MSGFVDNKVNRFYQRTLEHIHRVQLNALYLVTHCAEELGLSYEDCLMLMRRVMIHDLSKYSSEQFEPYVELSNYYYRRKVLKDISYEMDAETKKQTDVAVEKHFKAEEHHPEMFGRGSLSQWCRLDAIECVCDLEAMAQEFNEGSCEKYFEDKWMSKSAPYFSDDFNWFCIQGWMRECIRCFKSRLKPSA